MKGKPMSMRRYRVTLNTGEKTTVSADNNWNSRLTANLSFPPLKLFGVHIERVDRIDIIDKVETDKLMNTTIGVKG